MKTEFKAIVPIHIYNFEGPEFVDAQINAMEDLAKVNPICYFNILGDMPLLINYLGCEQNMPAYGKTLNYKGGVSPEIKCHLVEFCGSYEIDETEINNRLNEFHQSDNVEIVKSICSYDISILVNNLFIIGNLARPGLLQMMEGGVFVNDKFYKTIDPSNNNLYTSYDRCIENKWPPVNRCSIQKSWKWCNNIPGFKEGIGENPCGRAIAAFSYLFKSGIGVDCNMDIVWALLGLESLYCQANTGLQNQLLERSEAFLGKRVDNKKELSKMYDFRSRFIHGNVNFPFQYSYNDEYPKFKKRIEETTDEAVGLLISTLQKMIAEDIFELNFKCVYS